MINNMKKNKAIVILGGGLKKDQGTWRTTNYDEGDNFGVSGDRVIVVAANFLSKDYPEYYFIASGGKGQYREDVTAPTVASVIKKELIDFGVPKTCIVEEDKSNNTFQQLKNIQTICIEENLIDLLIVSNRHSLSRIQAMIEYKEELAYLKKIFKTVQLKLISAEDVLLQYEPNIWKEIIEDAYKSPSMKSRIMLEEQGTRQIKEGTYKFV